MPSLLRWVVCQDSGATSIEIDCTTLVDQFIKAAKLEFPSRVGQFDNADLSLHLTSDSERLDREQTVVSLSRGHNAGTALVLKAPNTTPVSNLSPSSSKESINSTASVERKRRIADLVEFTNTHKKLKEDG